MTTTEMPPNWYCPTCGARFCFEPGVEPLPCDGRVTPHDAIELCLLEPAAPVVGESLASRLAQIGLSGAIKVGVQPQTNADLPEHRVSVVVFATVRAVDERDAADLAERAVCQALSPSGKIVFRDPHRNFQVPVEVALVRELRNTDGYLYVGATPKAYRGS
jgi:hypothetical protein